MFEKQAWKMNGFLALLLSLITLFGAGYAFFQVQILAGILLIIVFVLMVSSIMVVQPNEAKAITFFGSYIGSVRESGLWMTIPFTSKPKVSLRVRNFNSKMLKVNDIDGNPIEIEGGYSLRGNADQVAGELAGEIQERLKSAGVEVIEARLTHLAYATEIASAMLQRQQATAIIAARQKIVEGAVGMVQMALDKLEKEHIVELDDERKAVMINNLMVAIVSDRAASPVINTGTLY
ncbi:MAG: hypothetical protein H6Q64_1725 [Firmicutes bacterium]|nr:hypothetical protein [Bacillota bacterium]